MMRRTRILGQQLPGGMSDQSHRLDRSGSRDMGRDMGSVARSTSEPTHLTAGNEPYRECGTNPFSGTGNEATSSLRTKPSNRRTPRLGFNSFEKNGLRRIGPGLTLGPFTSGHRPRPIRSQFRRRNEANFGSAASERTQFGPTASERTRFRSPVSERSQFGTLVSERSQFRFPAIGRGLHPLDPFDRLRRTVLLGLLEPENQVEGASS
jgi:hypothetical protein